MSIIQKKLRVSTDQDFALQNAPRRPNYRKISEKTKRQLVGSYLKGNTKISVLAKRYHLSYATVSNIIKVQYEGTKTPQQDLQVKIQEVKEEPYSEPLGPHGTERHIAYQVEAGPYYPFYIAPPPYYYPYHLP